MTTTGRKTAIAGVAAVVTVALAWVLWQRVSSADERAIRARLEALCAEINASAVARPEQIGSYFTEDAVVDLGKGTAAINGRQTLIGMAARLQPRTAAFRLAFDDIGVTLSPDRTAADVALTASFVLRRLPTGDESRDAREFSVALTRADGAWRIARATAVEVLR